ncbi:MAG TPA: hypothetical protein VF980_06870 [Thermoanaerobaculia bacterium]
MTALRKLNAKGIAEFRIYLGSIRAGAEFQKNPALLYVDEFSSAVRPRIEIEQRTLRTKLDAAKYLTQVLEPIEGPGLTADVGLWSWLALFFFDQLSPLRADGKRRPREDYHYIPNDRRPHRHLLAGAYQLYRLHGDRARVLLHPAVHQHGRFIFDLDYRRDLLTNRGLIEVADQLYWNARTNRVKRGAASDGRPGSLRRLIAVAQQLELNYDLYGMSAQEIRALLPPEFESW